MKSQLTKNPLLLTAFIMALSCALFANAFGSEKFIKVDRSDFDQSHFIGWVPDQVIVQFKESLPSSSMRKTPGGMVAFTEQSLNAISAKFEFTEIERQFKNAKYQFGVDQVDLTRHYRVTFLTGADPLDVVAELKNDPNVESAEPIGIHRLYAAANDTYYNNPPAQFPYELWGLWDAHGVNAEDAWDQQAGDDQVAVGILDSGTRYFHLDLGGDNPSNNPWGPGNPQTNGNIWVNPGEIPGNGQDDDGNGRVDDVIGWDFVTSAGGGGVQCQDQDCSGVDNDPDDGDGHGTHVSGTVAAITNNGRMVAGVAGGFSSGAGSADGNGVKVIPCRIGYRARYQGQVTGVVRMDWAAEAMTYLAGLKNSGVNIAAINCSWGSSNSGGLNAAVDALQSADVLIVHAAGNSGSQSADFLGNKAGVLNVAATDRNGNGASFSNHGSWVDVAAPGVEIISTYANPDDPDLGAHYVAVLDGTSMSAPHVVGIAALLESCNSSLSRTDKFNLIVGNTTAYSDSRDLGSGIANAALALAAANCGGGGCTETTPVADFSGSPTSGNAPLTVNFTDLSSNNPDSWSWNFGDGGSSSSQNPSHQYTSGGTYTVTLTASNCAGSDQEVKTSYITVTETCNETTPVADFSGSPTSGDAPLTVNFTDLSSNNPSSWSWDFGDGGSSNAQNPSHQYASAGTYTVTLTASNCAGSDPEVKTNYITVTSPPQLTMHVEDIQVTRDSKGPNWEGVGTITIWDSNNNPVSNATVSVTATGPTGGSGSGVTDGNGQVTFTTAKIKNPVGEWCFEVTNVTHASFTYNSAENVVTQACESGPVFSDGDPRVAEVARPGTFHVYQNAPNPFNPSTKITFATPTAGYVEVAVYNIMGQKVAVLFEGEMGTGEHSVEWNATQFSSGVYLYSVKSGDQVITRKMTLLK